jgi:hypothetical protein
LETEFGGFEKRSEAEEQKEIDRGGEDGGPARGGPEQDESRGSDRHKDEIQKRTRERHFARRM